MIGWIVENKDLLFFGQGMFALAAIYHVAHGRINGRSNGRSNGRRPQSGEKTALNVESVFDQLRGTPTLQYGDVSRRYIGTRVKATGSLGGVRKLTDDLMSISVIPHGVRGSVSTGVPFSEYREIVQSDRDITLEGEIEYMELDNSHELYLSDAKVSLTL
jgi:hypothetical protein